jgi:uncharacterized protein (TIGR03437 family)
MLAKTALASLPEFLRDRQSPQGYLVAAHTNWDGRVSVTNPARPAEVVHAYAVGLGLTQSAVAHGDAAPSAEPLGRLAPALQCYHPQNGEPIEVLFAGLAPTMVGVYQIDFRVPIGANDGFFVLWCSRGQTPSLSTVEITGAVRVDTPRNGH